MTHRINHQIKAAELRVIDEADKNIGILALTDALKLAQEKGLDLVEIAPLAQPPVAKIISFDKYRYQEAKKAKKLQAKQKSTGTKQVQISVREAKNDLLMKIGRLQEFLTAGNQVIIVMRLRGREKANKDFAKKKLAEFMAMIPVPYKMISQPQFGGYGLNLKIAPEKK